MVITRWSNTVDSAWDRNAQVLSAAAVAKSPLQTLPSALCSGSVVMERNS